MRRTIARALPVLLLTGAAFAAPGSGLQPIDEVDTEIWVSAHMVADLDGDSSQEIVVVGWRGEVRVVRRRAAGQLTHTLGELTLPHPSQSLVTLGRVAGDDRMHLFVASPDGVDAYPSVPDGGFAVRPLRLAPRARFTMRVGGPRLAPIVRELNGDGLSDVIVPYPDHCDVWLQTLDAEGKPTLTRTASVSVDVQQATVTEGGALTDVLESTFTIPELVVEDVNGDGRGDLLVTDGDVRAFHLQRDDGTYPAEPDVRVDLSMFRDTTPEAEVQLGRTLAGEDDQRYESRDLDGDGIPDHVIAHRRKVWVFMGGRDGPQFESPAAILKTAEDVTALLLIRVDEDALPDLVLIRLQVPTAAAILKGLLTEWDVDLTAVGYRGRRSGGFDTEAAWRSELTIRLPALLGIVRDPDALIRRFEDVVQRFGRSVTADLDGDGTSDVLMVDTDGAPRADVWLGSGPDTEDDAERAIGRVLFRDDDRTWTLDRMLSALGDLAQRRAAQLTGGREPSGSLVLRDLHRSAVLPADLDGDGRQEIVILYRGPKTGILDVLAWR